MLILRNAYPDRDLTITTRNPTTGADGDTLTLKVGDPGQAIELDGDHQIVISTRPRQPGEPAMGTHTQLHAVDEPLDAAAAPKPPAAAPKPPKPPKAKAVKEAVAPVEPPTPPTAPAAEA